MPFRALLAAFGVCAALAGASSLGAQDDPARTPAPSPDSAAVRRAAATIDTDGLDLATVRTLAELLQGRVPGMIVRSLSGTIGTAPRIHVRGASGIAATPPLVIVDGVRLADDPFGSSLAVGGQAPSRLDDLDPDAIERVEVLTGVAAAARYGSVADGGVILVTTRRGAPGRIRVRAHAERGMARESTDFPANFNATGQAASGPIASCSLQEQAAGQCTVESLFSHSPLAAASPFRVAELNRVGVHLGGGGSRGSFALSAAYLNETGIVRTSDRERLHLRGGGLLRPLAGVEVELHAGYTDAELGLPINDNATLGYLFSGLAGRAVDDPERRGYGGMGMPQDLGLRIDSRQGVERLSGGLRLGWTPLPWLLVEGRAGSDRATLAESQVRPPMGGITEGHQEGDGVRRREVYSLGTMVTRDLPGSIRSVTALSVEQQADSSFHQARIGMPGGPRGGWSMMAKWNGRAAVLRQEVTWRERLTVGALLRADRPYFPGVEAPPEVETQQSRALTASWAALPARREGWLNRLDLHASYGSLPQRVSFFPLARGPGTFNDVDPMAPRPIDPEPLREWEAGAVTSLFAERARLGLTAYRREAAGAFIGLLSYPYVRPIAGDIHNRGVEGTLDLLALRTASTRVDLHVVGGWNRNRVDNLVNGNIAYLEQGDRQMTRDGEPLGGFVSPRLARWEDRDGDGIIASWGCAPVEHSDRFGQPGCELLTSGEWESHGSALPTRHLSLGGSVAWRGAVRASLLLEHQGGNKLYNATAALRCSSLTRCREAYDRATPLAEQARLGMGPGGHIEDAGFVKLREVALTLGVPRGWTGGRALDLTLAGRNLATWTRYTGLDPEVSSGGASTLVNSDRFAQPQVPFATVRLSARL